MAETEKPLPLEELKKKRVPLRNYYKSRKDRLNTLERSAIAITEKIGTFGFFAVLLIWTVLWLGWNTLAPTNLRFDPFPAFVLWLFISNMIQLFLLPLLLISDNLQDRVFEENALADLEVNVRSERELEVVIQHLEYQNQLLEKLLEKKK